MKKNPARLIAPTLSLLLLLFATSYPVFSQDKILVSNCRVSFTSDAPLELIKAESSQGKMVIDPVTNQFAVSVPVNSFQGFNSGLQREHFNEKYMESEKYPTATFMGKIIETMDFSKDGTYVVRAKGTLNIHGQKQTRIIKAKVTIKNKMISVVSDFTIPLADHNISMPKLISEKIASEIQVNFNSGAYQQ